MHAEAYEDNAGMIHLFAVEGEEPVWGCAYYGDDEVRMAAADMVGIAVQGLDPVHEGWDGMDPAALAEDYAGFLGCSVATSIGGELFGNFGSCGHAAALLGRELGLIEDEEE